MAELGTFEYDISIVAGVNWEFTFWLLDDNDDAIDLTGYSAQMDIRETLEGDVIDHLVSGGEITITAASGKVSAVLSKTATAALGIRKGVWDIILQDGSSNRYRVGKGEVSVSPTVTAWV